MSILRRLPTSRLIALCVVVVALLGTGAAVAVAALSTSAGAPPPKPLAQAVRDSLGAAKVPGVTARIRFTNKLIDDSSLEGGSALLKGATGRLWATDGHLRLELQSSSGDVQILADEHRFSLYDASSNTVYRGTLPRQRASGKQDKDKKAHRIPTVAKIQSVINDAMRDASVSGAIPGTVAGQPTYTLRVGPKHDGGLLGAGEVAWDAVRGVPLRAAIYAQGSDSPVLELTATDISYGPVPASDFAAAPPSSAKVVQVRQPSPDGARSRAGEAKRRAHKSRRVRGIGAVKAAVPFKLSAPAKLVGLPRREVKLLDWGGKPAALVAYGENLGGVAVIERGAQAATPAKAGGDRRGEHRGQLQLPTISINGASGNELATALGTVVTFQRGGVSYTVIGSVPPAAAEAAAREL